VLAGLAQQLYQHVATLVHHRRRVTVTWHRHKGPAFVNAFLKALPTADQRLPDAIDGMRFGDAVAAMRRALELEGNSELRAALAEHGDWVQALVAHARSIPSLLAALEAPW
jgi:hypothetical protein